MRPRPVLMTAACILALSALFATAGPRAVPPQPRALLTDWEQDCAHAGQFTYDVARARDAGTPLTNLLVQRRALDRHLDPGIRKAREGIILAVFQAYALSPALIRQQAETACIAYHAGHQTPAPRTPGEWR